MKAESLFDDRPADWLDFEEARARILAHAHPLGPCPIPLLEATDRVLAEPVRAPFAMPPWDNSAMDGYAVRHADLASADGGLRLAGEARAGAPLGRALEEGEVARIMTGAPLPEGADTVVRFEDTRWIGDRVQIAVVPTRGRNVRRAGEDFARGDTLGAPGRVITPGLLALLVAAGHAQVVVHERPRLGLLVSGDELLPPGSRDAVARGEGIIDSNTAMLTALGRAAGAEVHTPGTVPDAMDATLDALRATAARSDFLVTAGGASVGAHDLFRSALERLDFELDFWRIKLRPGSPVSMGVLDVDGRRVPVLGLPGNPSSAFVTFHLFARPFLHRLSGRPLPPLAPLRALAEERIGGARGLTMFARVQISVDEQGALRARPSGAQGSGLLVPLSRAQGLALVPPEPGAIEVGQPVRVLPLGDPGEWAVPMP